MLIGGSELSERRLLGKNEFGLVVDDESFLLEIELIAAVAGVPSYMPSPSNRVVVMFFTSLTEAVVG